MRPGPTWLSSRDGWGGDPLRAIVSASQKYSSERLVRCDRTTAILSRSQGRTSWLEWGSPPSRERSATGTHHKCDVWSIFRSVRRSCRSSPHSRHRRRHHHTDRQAASYEGHRDVSLEELRAREVELDCARLL